MAERPADRICDNVTEIVATLVTGIWLAALFTGQEWWLAALLVGYVVVVPLFELVLVDERNEEAPADGSAVDHTDPSEEDTSDALGTLRDRCARGELTDDQFEWKLDRLLETESLEDVEDRVRSRERESE